MKINDSAKGNMNLELSATPASKPVAASSDIAWFSAELEKPEGVQGGITPGQSTGSLFNQLSSTFNQLESDRNNMGNVLRKASRSTDPLVLTKVDGQLSDYYLENTLNAKIVSKTVQGLEKLTNLQ